MINKFKYILNFIKIEILIQNLLIYKISKIQDLVNKKLFYKNQIIFELNFIMIQINIKMNYLILVKIYQIKMNKNINNNLNFVKVNQIKKNFNFIIIINLMNKYILV